jgi:hypothetical protein
VRHFNEGAENVHDDPWSGQPPVVNEDLVRAVEKKIQENRRFTISSLCLHFPQISRSLLHEIVSDKLRGLHHKRHHSTIQGYKLIPRYKCLNNWKLCRKVAYGMYIKRQYKWFGNKSLLFFQLLIGTYFLDNLRTFFCGKGKENRE